MADVPTVLLHLSDIHFRHGRSGTAHDLDADLRNQLERDVLELRNRLGVIHGILVSGDIAFSGGKDEYEIASAWLHRLCELLGCETENVWTVCGNHDVQRDVIRKSNQLQLLHGALRDGAATTLDERLRMYLLDDEEAAEMLFRPLHNYNAFAFQFRCELGPKKLFWEHNLILNDGSTLRLRGVNSTIVSDEKDDVRVAPLVVGSAQSLIQQQDGVEHLFVCHHPPDWLLDRDIEDHLRRRTRLQLFGHKHSGRLYSIGDSLRIVAGATHPDRTESEWEPTFNAVSVSIRNRDGTRTMELDVYPRIWSKRDLCFKADLSGDRTENHHWLFRLPSWTPPAAAEISAKVVIETAATVEQAAETSVLEAAPSSGGGRLVNPARRLTYRFMSLPYQRRIEVAQELKLIENEDSDLNDSQRYEAYFRRAKERGLLPKLWEAVELAHGVETRDNPFV